MWGRSLSNAAPVHCEMKMRYIHMPSTPRMLQHRVQEIIMPDASSSSGVVTTTPAPAEPQFSISEFSTWGLLHWMIAGLGLAVVILLAYLLYRSRSRSLPQVSTEPVDSQFGKGSYNVLASFPPERRLDMLSRLV